MSDGSITRQDDSAGRSTPTPAAVFACNGEYWIVGYDSKTFSLKDTRGLRYVQRLLQHAGEEFHSLDLLNSPGAQTTSFKESSPVLQRTDLHVAGLGDAGEMLDAQAKQSYKQKLAELGQELEDVLERGDAERAAEIETERDFLLRELARAVGLGGRDRRAGSAAERARLNVTRAIRAALQKVSEHHAAFGELLGRTIRTGSFCSYVPDAHTPIAWRFSREGQPVASARANPPLLLRSEPALLQALSNETIFVGRDGERAILRRCIEEARRGEGKVVMISGAPGVGKTRIATEMAGESSDKGFLSLSGSCYDRDDAVPFLPIVEILEMALARASSREAFRRSLASDAGELARLLPQLRRIFDDIPPPLEVAPQQSRRILYNAVVQLLNRVSANGPVLLLFEDLHWADEGTLSLLSHAARSILNLPVIILGTYRDTDLDSAGPLQKTLDELTRSHMLERITLQGLSKSEVAAMLRALSGREPPDTIASVIHSITEGNPFFVEELFNDLEQRGKLFNSRGQFRSDLNFDEIDVPGSLRLMVGRHLAQMSEKARKLLAIAAVLGRSFTFDLLEATAPIEADSILDCLEEAERRGVIASALEYPQARFQFSHELIRRAVLSGLSSPRRQRLHLTVAEAIERLDAGALAEHVNERAYHLWHAGSLANSERTISCLATAARYALEQGSYETAAQHSRNALDLFERLSAPDRNRLTRIELALQTVIGSALMPSKGYASVEVERAFIRAKELCTEMDGSAENIPVLLGLGIFFLVKARYDVVCEVSESALSLAEKENDDSATMEANLRSGIALFYLGDLGPALTRIQRVLALYDPRKHQRHAAIYGQDPAMAAQVCAACILWLLGFPDQARCHAEAGIQRAAEIQHNLSTVYAYDYCAMLYGWLSEHQRAEELLSATLRISREEGFAFWSAIAMVFHGAALTERGEFEKGIAEICEGLQDWESSGALAPGGFLLLLLARAQQKHGDIDEAKITLEKAATTAANTGERFLEAEIYRVRGELILAGSECSLNKSIEAKLQFDRAIEIAHSQSAKSLELRATLSLARLFERQGKSGLGFKILKLVYSQFTEGFGTADLREAEDLMRALSK